MVKLAPYRMNPLALPRGAKLRIGLLGGSFNPPHEGHVEISLQLKKLLGLRAVWWLVSPQNPLKAAKGTPNWQQRLAQCLALLAGQSQIVPTGIEARLGTRYTIDTLRALKKRWPQVEFVWLMGADNLSTFHRWRGWWQIAHMVPMVVADRAPFSHQALRSCAALALRPRRLKAEQLRQLPARGWGFVHLKRHSASSTALRKKTLEKPAK